jgi:putative Mg2+ transporter-C (MgtC) family protein
MLYVNRIEISLPSHAAIAVTMHFRPGLRPDVDALRLAANHAGYFVALGSLSIVMSDDCIEWRFVAVAHDKHKGATVNLLARMLSAYEGVDRYQLGHARN